MFRVEPKGDNRLDIELSGKLDSDGMRSALDELISLSEHVSHGKMLYRIGQFRLPTLAALGVEFARLPALLRLLGKYDRVAVVADQEWIQKLSELEGMLIPGLTIKSFDLDDEDEAEAWLAG